MPIYTKKGDKGSTATIDNYKLSKSDQRIKTIGAIDEVNTYVGLAGAFVENKDVNSSLIQVQTNLFKINSILAGANLSLSIAETRKLEKKIDDMDLVLPKLINFIFPGGSRGGAFLHTTRTIVRRAERELASYNLHTKVKPSILAYLNRLSDYIFTLARYVNQISGFEETKWRT